MESKVKHKEAPFLNTCPQGSHPRDLRLRFLSYLLFASHQNSCSPAFSSGTLLFLFLFLFRVMLSVWWVLFELLFFVNLGWKCWKITYFGQLDESFFVGIEVGQCLVIKDSDGDFTVTAFDANHCPGVYCVLMNMQWDRSFFFSDFSLWFLFSSNFYAQRILAGYIGFLLESLVLFIFCSLEFFFPDPTCGNVVGIFFFPFSFLGVPY